MSGYKPVRGLLYQEGSDKIVRGFTVGEYAILYCTVQNGTPRSNTIILYDTGLIST